MSLKPVYGVGTGRFGLAAILTQSIGHCAQKLSGNPLSPQRTVHKGMVDDSNALLFREGYFTFAKGSSLTTHRIVAVTDEGYRTQGDANNAADPDPVAPQEVVGRVVGHLPGIGGLLAALKTPLGMTLLLFVGLILLELPLFFRGQRNEREET